MSTIFTEANTGLDDKGVIKKMNEEYESMLQSDFYSYDYINSSDLYKKAINEYCMYKILLKYKDEYYQNLNVISCGPPDFFGEDSEIQTLYRSLVNESANYSSEYTLLEDKFAELQSKVDKLNEQFIQCKNNLESAKKKNNLYMDIRIEREKYEKLKSYHGTEH